jgi:hypothetical protein
VHVCWSRVVIRAIDVGNMQPWYHLFTLLMHRLFFIISWSPLEDFWKRLWVYASEKSYNFGRVDPINKISNLCK